MNRIHVLAPGMQSSLQDLGRFGWAHFGVSASGAADAVALRAGNLVVGNAENAAAIEMTLTGGVFELEGDAVIALTGSDFGAELPRWTAVEVKAGQTLRLRATRTGARCYLCVRGGIASPRTMGSASAHLTTGVGGRALRKGDVIEIGEDVVRRPRDAVAGPPEWSTMTTLRVTPGPQAEWFDGALGDFYGSEYVVSEETNRMGIRLRGQAMASPAGHMLTEGVALGAVQIPPDGQPIVLFVEHQTTGGYPKPANVISADFHLLGQLRPRDRVRFAPVNMERALEALREQEAWLYGI